MKLSTILVSAAMTLLATACDEATTARDAVQTQDDAGRGGLGKADHLEGFCGAVDGEEAAACGGPAPVGNCWCDESCVDYGDCCVDSFDACGVGEPQPAVSQCLADAHCEAGQQCSGGVCVGVALPDCDDGSSLSQFCDIKPGCDDGQVAAVINSCFQCVDELTCEPPAPETCDDGSSLSQFCDIKPGCDDGQVAAVINSCFQCVDALTCEPPAPETCDDGSSLSQFCDIKPVCDAGEVAAVIGSCFQCVDAVTCE
ncbi:MAG: hypothetical protein AAF721_31535 [Myxococcota bacterium]